MENLNPLATAIKRLHEAILFLRKTNIIIRGHEIEGLN